MRFTPLLALGSMMGAAAAAAPSCAADNCLRAVKGSARPTRMGTQDCSSYFVVTVTPVTSTLVATNTILATTTTVDLLAPLPPPERRDGFEKLVVRQVTVSPSSIPQYASACSGSARYSSACSCLGVTHSTVTAVAPLATTTTTVASTVVATSLFARPSLIIQQFPDNYCNNDDLGDLPTREIVEGECYINLPNSFNIQDGSFSAGDCATQGNQCFLYEYGDENCALLTGAGYGDGYVGCVDAADGTSDGPYVSLQLVCPLCPPAA